ncbi:MAG: hypothetical protein AAGP08_08520 [Pseudomonadota bacterium]
MIRYICLVLCALMPFAAAADVYRVVSGNHATFARLVVLSNELPDWDLRRGPNGYVLSMDGATSFDLARAFEKIPRDRISDASDLGEGRLEVSITCECYADAFPVAAGLVIDVRDGLPPAESPFEEPLGNNAEVPVEVTQASVSLNIGLTERRTYRRNSTLWSEASGRPSLFLQSDDAPEVAMALPEADTHQTPLDPELSAALVEQFGRAISQGVVQPSLETVLEADPPAPTPRPEEPRAVNPEEIDLTDFSEDAGETSHIRFETVFDRSRPNEMGVEAATAKYSCVDDRYLDVASWQPDGTAEQGYSFVRATGIGSSDANELRAIEDHAKTLIYLSFGAETRALIDDWPVLLERNPLLMDLANLVDGARPENTVFTVQDLNCASRVSLWAMLALPTNAVSEPFAKDIILLSFSELPAHLRKLLGPNLVQKFLALDDAGAAEQVSNSMVGRSLEPAEEVLLAVSEVALADGDVSEAVAGFSSVSASGGPIAASATVRVIDTVLAESGSVDDKLATTAAALSHEAKGTPDGVDLERTRLRAQIRGDNPLDVLKQISASVTHGKLSPSDADELALELYEHAITAAEDAKFSTLFISTAARPQVILADRRLSFGAAGRLLDLGMVQEAQQILLSFDGPFSPEELSEMERLGRAGNRSAERVSLSEADLEAPETPDGVDVAEEVNELLNERAMDAQGIREAVDAGQRELAEALVGSGDDPIAAIEARLQSSESLRNILDGYLQAPAVDR